MAIEKSTLTEKNSTAVYNGTTTPKKPKRRDKSDLGPDFVAPDGGWGWVVCLAAGFSNFSTFPALQQYGLIYRHRLANLGFNAKQTTTIVNIIMALSSIIGIVNGAMFRRFTFRQVAMVGGCLVFTGIFLSAFCVSFIQYVICFSCIYGIGLGLNMAAVSLAVNTYFRKQRRRATGFSWTITGLGPIIFPQVSTFLLAYYGVQGTILVYSAITLNAIFCGITLQPVLWHVKKPEKTSETTANGDVTSVTVETNEDDYECRYCQLQKRGKRSIFSSQHFLNDDDSERQGYEITEPDTPMLARANDGWYGSKMSLASDRHGGVAARQRQKLLRQLSTKSGSSVRAYPDLTMDKTALYKANNSYRDHDEMERYKSNISVYSKSGFDDYRCTCADAKALLENLSDEEQRLAEENIKVAEEAEELAKQTMTFRQKAVKFFDLDLLKDLTFVNLAMGMTIMMFGEMNFSVLTPFILSSYGYENQQISLAMSLLGGMDIAVRFLAPFALEKVKLDNRVLFAFGIVAISIGRFVITFTQSFNVILAMFVLIGFGKGFRTIFSPLIIASYVPLNRLPAASGLQLISNGIFSLCMGPVLGMITDAYSYNVTIHAINTCTCFALLLWVGESFARRMLNKPAIPMDVE